MDWLEDMADRLVRGVSGTFAEPIRDLPETEGVRVVAVWGPNGYGISLRHRAGTTYANVLVYRCTRIGEIQAWGIPGGPKTMDGVDMERDEIKALAFRLSLVLNNFGDVETMDHSV